MKLLIVADGIAEDVFPDNKTSLESAPTPFIDFLFNNGISGLFDPCYESLKIVKTDLVIGEILNIIPTPWPGRAYFEVIDKMGRDYLVSMSAIIRIKFTNKISIGEQKKKISTIQSLGMKHGYISQLRTYERNQSSLLIWTSSNDTNLMGEENLTSFTQDAVSIFSDGITIECAEVWNGGNVCVNLFKIAPCFIANSIGSLTGLCRSAGFDVIPEAGSPFALEHQKKTLMKAKEYIESGLYEFGVLYFKAPDWASHEGNRGLKINIIEFIDKVLQETIGELLETKKVEVLFISDHRTNIGSDSASLSTSVFLLSPFDSNVTVKGKFCERTVESNFNGYPLSLEQLGGLFFHGDKQ